jgi:hypothetical protein
VRESVGEAAELDGFDELSTEDQAKIVKAFEEVSVLMDGVQSFGLTTRQGHVADADVPESAHKQDGDEGEEEEDQPKKKKRAPPKKKAAEADDEDAEEKPKPKRAPRKKAQVSETILPRVSQDKQLAEEGRG